MFPFGDSKTFCSCSCRDFGRTRYDLTALFLNHSLTNLDRDFFEDNEIDHVPDPPNVNDKCKKCEEKIKEKHVPDLMDSSDFENAIGKSGSWVFFNKLF